MSSSSTPTNDQAPSNAAVAASTHLLRQASARLEEEQFSGSKSPGIPPAAFGAAGQMSVSLVNCLSLAFIEIVHPSIG